MKVASNVHMNGMAGGNDFNRKLADFIPIYKPKYILETGTYMGTGTTQAIINSKGNARLITIEVNPDHYNKAFKNIDDPDTMLLNGLSIPKALLPQTLDLSEYPDSVFIDHEDAERWQLYQNEVSHNVRDNMINTAMGLLNNYRPEMVVLDSAGHMGTIEFDYFMTLYRGHEFILALDDTHHIKHYKTVQKIKTDKRFKLIWETFEKFGSAIYHFKD